MSDTMSDDEGGGGWGQFLNPIPIITGIFGQGSKTLADQGTVDYNEDLANSRSLAQFIANEQKAYYESKYNYAGAEELGYKDPEPADIEVPLNERRLGKYLKLMDTDQLRVETTFNRFIEDNPEVMDRSLMTGSQGSAALAAYKQLPRENQLDPTSYEINYEKGPEGFIFKGIEIKPPFLQGVTAPIEAFDELLTADELKATKERQQDFTEIMQALNKGDVERIEDWADLTRQLMNFYSYFSIYAAAQDKADSLGSEASDETKLKAAERFLRNEFAEKGLQFNEDLITGLTEIENPKDIARALELVMYNYAEPLRPHVGAYLGTNDETVIAQYLGKGPTSGEKIKGFGGEIVGDLYSTPFLGDFLTWLDRPSQSAFFAIGGLYQGAKSLVQGNVGEAGSKLYEGMDAAGNELGLFLTGDNEVGLFDVDRESSFDLNDDDYIDIFEVFGTQNTMGVAGDIINIIAAVTLDPLTGIGVGNRFSRNVLNSIVTESLQSSSAITRAAATLGVKQPVIVDQGFKSALIHLKEDGWKALTKQEKELIELVIREHISMVYEKFPNTRRVRAAAAMNNRGISAIENDVRRILKQLERGGRDGFRYYGRTLFSAQSARDVLNRFAPKVYQTKPTLYRSFIIHADGSRTALPEELINQPTLYDEAAEFDQTIGGKYNPEGEAVLARMLDPDDLASTPEQIAIVEAAARGDEAFFNARIEEAKDPMPDPKDPNMLEDYFPAWYSGWGDSPAPWAKNTPMPTAQQIDWYNSMIGLKWIQYDFVLPLEKGNPSFGKAPSGVARKKYYDKQGNLIETKEVTERFYQGGLFTLLDDTGNVSLKADPNNKLISDDIARPYGESAAERSFDNVVSEFEYGTDALGQQMLPFQETAEVLIKYLSNEAVFPPTPAGNAAKAAYIQQLTQTIDAPIMRLVMEKQPSLGNVFFYQEGLIRALRVNFSPRFEIQQAMGKVAADDVRTQFTKADMAAQVKFQEWVDRVFRVETFGGKSLAMRAKEAWESLPPQMYKGTKIPRSFELGPQSLIAQITTAGSEIKFQQFLKKHPAGTPVGDWIRAFDELREEIWNVIPANLKKDLNRWDYSPRISSVQILF